MKEPAGDSGETGSLGRGTLNDTGTERSGNRV